MAPSSAATFTPLLGITAFGEAGFNKALRHAVIAMAVEYASTCMLFVNVICRIQTSRSLSRSPRGMRYRANKNSQRERSTLHNTGTRQRSDAVVACLSSHSVVAEANMVAIVMRALLFTGEWRHEYGDESLSRRFVVIILAVN